jgi:hypothetical protein
VVAELGWPARGVEVNLGAARADLQARGYSRFTPARLTAFLNTAKNRFEDYPFDWPWLKTATAGTTPLTIADLRRVRSVVDPTSRLPLEPVDAEDVVDFEDTDLTRVGPALQWYLTSETVLASYPVGSASLNVRYVKFSPELSGDSDTPLIPVRYHQTWVDLAEIDCLRFGTKDRDSASAMEAEVFRRLEEIASVYAMQAAPLNDAMFMSGQSVDG